MFLQRVISHLDWKKTTSLQIPTSISLLQKVADLHSNNMWLLLCSFVSSRTFGLAIAGCDPASYVSDKGLELHQHAFKNDSRCPEVSAVLA